MCKNCEKARAEYEKINDPAWAEYKKIRENCEDNKKCSKCGK